MKAKRAWSYFILFLLSGISQMAIAQIHGRLLDASSREAIDYADIFLYETGNSKPIQQTFPNERGEFRFEQVGKGGYDILSKRDIEANGSPVNLGDLMMKPLEVGIAEVEVVASKRQLVYKLDKKVVEATSNMMAGGGSAVDVLENTPSIRVDAEGDVTFRGSSGFLVYIDGKPSVFTGTQALEQVPAGHIENIEIITTPSAKHDTEGDVGTFPPRLERHDQPVGQHLALAPRGFPSHPTERPFPLVRGRTMDRPDA